MTKLIIKTTICEADKKIINAIKLINDIRDTLEKNKNYLNNKNWTGLANEKCKQINQVLIQYELLLATIIQEIHTNVNNLKIQTENYDESLKRRVRGL